MFMRIYHLFKALPIAYFLLLIFFNLGYLHSETKWFPGHYLQLTYDQNRSAWAAISNEPSFAGGMKIYLWKDLEPQKGQYDFTSVLEDLKWLSNCQKKYLIEIWDNYFLKGGGALPEYLLTEPEYQGGVIKRNASGATQTNGSVAKRWVPALTDRYLELVKALGKEIDSHPNFAGFVHTETAITLGEGAGDFDAKALDQQYRRWIGESKNYFPTSVVIQLGNYTPYGGIEALTSLASYARENKVGWGGPDILPDKKVWGYEVMRTNKNAMPIGIASQYASYSGKYKAQELLDFAVNELGAHFIFWGNYNRETSGGLSFKKDIIPLVTREKGRVAKGSPVHFFNVKN